jgi:Asp-tRNA(Asn)/Glu-tRNA(Gln) amidotransferase A subunit family amidase
MANVGREHGAGSADWLVRAVDVGPTGSGPLDGSTVAVKELVAVGGVELSANTDVVLPDRWRRPTEDAAIVARLRAAGACVVGTALTHELAWGITTTGGRRRVVNPHHPARVAGGSSGGSAVAVASGAVDLAVGTDTAGSVRVPAAWCGVFGWKAGRDAVPTHGVLPLAPRFDHVGLLAARSELLVRAVRSVATPPLGRPVERLVTVQVVDAIADRRALLAVDRCRRAVRARLPHADRVVAVPAGTAEVFGLVQRAEALHAHVALIGTWPAQAERYSSDVRSRLLVAEGADPADVARARDEIDRLATSLRAALDGAVAVLPVTGCAPPSVDAPDAIAVEVAGSGTGAAGTVDLPLRSVVLPWTTPANIAGLPAVTVPWWIDGEPFGVQLLGGPGTDVALVELAAHLAANPASRPTPSS